jgi:hypothetical protein
MANSKRLKNDSAVHAPAASLRSVKATSKRLSRVVKNKELEPKSSEGEAVRPARKAHELRDWSANSKELEDALEFLKIAELGAAIRFAEGLSSAEKSALVLRVCELYVGLDPKTTAEGMLSSHMVDTHFLAKECMRRAMDAAATPQQFVMYLREGTRLMELYIKQLDARDKLRGRSQSPVHVSQLNVGPGGQAIVGNVDASGGAGRRQDSPEAPMFDVTPNKDEDESRGSAD